MTWRATATLCFGLAGVAVAVSGMLLFALVLWVAAIVMWVTLRGV